MDVFDSFGLSISQHLLFCVKCKLNVRLILDYSNINIKVINAFGFWVQCHKEYEERTQIEQEIAEQAYKL